MGLVGSRAEAGWKENALLSVCKGNCKRTSLVVAKIKRQGSWDRVEGQTPGYNCGVLMVLGFWWVFFPVIKPAWI